MSSAATPAFQYLVQVFVTFSARAEHRPLLIRIDETASVGATIATALERIRQSSPDALPSSDVTEFALCHAQGDGTVDPSTAAPLDPQVVLRDAGLQFPFMLALVFVGGAEDSDRPGSPASLRDTVSASQIGAALSAQEREAAAARLAEVQRRREENVKAIEAGRAASDLQHFHQAETYELQRREAATKAKAAQLAAERAEAVALQQQKALQEDAANRAAHAQREEMELHRRRMQAAIEAENIRLEEAKKRQAAQEAANAERKRQAAAERQAALNASRHERMNNALEDLVGSLDVALMQRRAEEEALAEEQRQRRAEAAAQAQRLREVQALEAARGDVRLQERQVRITKSQHHEERTRMANITAVENDASRAEADESVFREWKRRQDEQTQELQGLLELELRQKRSSKLLAAGSNTSTR